MLWMFEIIVDMLIKYSYLITYSYLDLLKTVGAIACNVCLDSVTYCNL